MTERSHFGQSVRMLVWTSGLFAVQAETQPFAKVVSMAKFAIKNDRIIPFHDASIGIDAPALHYGLGLFAGIRGYWSSKSQQILLFRPRDHLRRLLENLTLLGAELPFGEDELLEQIKTLIQKENLREDTYCRSLAVMEEGSIGAKIHGGSWSFLSFLLPMGRLAPADRGLRVKTSTWQRVDSASIPARGKICGSYVNNALARSEAVLAGFDDAFLLRANGNVSEATAANIFVVKNGRLITPPDSDDILIGITRRTILELAEKFWNLPVEIRSLQHSELFSADEIFLTGTGIEIASVSSVDGQPVGLGVRGEVSQQVQSDYYRLVSGELTQYEEKWIERVTL